MDYHIFFIVIVENYCCLAFGTVTFLSFSLALLSSFFYCLNNEIFSGILRDISNSRIAFRYPFLSKSGITLQSSKRLTDFERMGFLNQNKEKSQSTMNNVYYIIIRKRMHHLHMASTKKFYHYCLPVYLQNRSRPNTVARYSG